uniref:Myomesin-2-like n=1 Tax=Hippocampus comes TaxID=109280 RepID=A0A3Q3DGT6_HIPCM
MSDPPQKQGKQYKFRVVSTNMYGTSEPSEPSRPIETQELKGVPSAPGQVIATRETDTTVLIQWTPPKEPNSLIGYYIDQCVKGSKDWTSANHKPHKNSVGKPNGLTTGETYVFRVQAINEIGLSEESQESAPLTVKAALTTPSAPYKIALVDCDGHSMVLNWKKPLHSGGSPIKEYYVDKRCSGTEMWREINIPPIVEGLTEGAVYQFQVYAANLIGLGPASKHSADYTCEAWTMPEPGPAYDLTFCEARDDSVVLEWQKPVYIGSGPITGYHVEYAKKGTNEWTTANETATKQCFLKVTGLEEGCTYDLRVRAVNDSGVGTASVNSDPVTAKALPGKEVSCCVDKKTGDIVFTFESCQMNANSQFVWKKDYEEITDFSKGVDIKTEGNKTQLILKNAEKEDFGIFSVSVTNTDGVSASLSISPDGTLCFCIIVFIPLKSELAYKILEQGKMRFWLQAEEISPNVTYKFFVNDKEMSGSIKMGHDVSAGVIELIMDHFAEENEGTYTCQIIDGGGKAQSSLVLIGDGKRSVWTQYKRLVLCIDGHYRLFSLKTSGLYKATISDDRGKDMSQIDISGKGKQAELLMKLIDEGVSAQELVIQCTATGIQLQCPMKYYTPEMNIVWYHGDKKLCHSDKIVIGGTPAMATMEVIEPTERDKGKYSIVITDPEDSHKHTLDLNGEGQSFLSLVLFIQHICTFEKVYRGKVIGGLPDVVTIMEKKTLSLTCTVCGDPKPQVSWLKNGVEVQRDDQISLDQGKFASLTIRGVSMEDSGKYSMIVQNKYGGESVDIVVCVYRQGEKIPEANPTVTAKTIIPPKLPIEMPQTVTQPAPSAPSPSPPRAAPGRGVKSPTPTRRVF